MVYQEMISAVTDISDFVAILLLCGDGPACELAERGKNFSDCLGKRPKPHCNV